MKVGNINTVVVLAAGEGTRLKPLTNFIPKPLLPIGKKCLIDRVLKNFKNVPNIFITVGYKKQLLTTHLLTNYEISGILNTSKKDNAWWLYNTPLQFLNEPVVVTTCDNIAKINIKKIYKDYISLKSPPCLLIPTTPKPDIQGDFIFCKKNKIYELNRNKKNNYYASGIQILNPLKVNQLTKPVQNFYNVWEQLIKKDSLYCSNVVLKKWSSIDSLVNYVDYVNIYI